MSASPPPFRAKDYLSVAYWPTWFGLSLLWLLSRLPFSWQLKVGTGFGNLLYRLIPSRRKICQKNLEFAFPDMPAQERETLSRKVFHHIGYSVAEIATVWFQPMSRLDHRFTLVGREHLEKAQATGKGIILLQAHFSTLEFCGSWIGTQVPEAAAVYDNPKNRLYASLLHNRRNRYISKLIDNRDIRQMARHLKSGRLVWYSPDQSVRKSDGGVETTYFGRDVLTTPGTSRIASLTGAIVLPYLPVRSETPGHYTLTIFPPVENFPTGDAVQDTETINRIFENHVRQHPEQYFWVHKRFKRISRDQPDPYR